MRGYTPIEGPGVGVGVGPQVPEMTLSKTLVRPV